MKRKPQSGRKNVGAAAINQEPDAAAVPPSYPALLIEIKERVRRAQLRAHLAVSRELVSLHWQIGRDIVLRQKLEGWGKSVIGRLAADIQKEFPGMEGFSARNIWRMRAFYLAYSEGDKMSQPVAEFGGPVALLSKTIILPEALAEIGETATNQAIQPILSQPATESTGAGVAVILTGILWGHLVLHLERVKVPAHRARDRRLYSARPQKPIGISGYFTRLSDTLPAAIKNVVPSVAELERGLTNFSE